MRPHHQERLAKSVTRLAAEFLERRQNETLITVSGTSLGNNNKMATVFLTIYPAAAENKTLAEVKIWRSELRDFLNVRLRGNPLTHIDFALDPLSKL